MEYTLDKRYLCFPIKSGNPLCKTRFILSDFIITLDLELTENEPDFWVYYDALYDIGQKIQIISEDESSILRAEDLAVLSDKPIDDKYLYMEENRPMYHFTAARGWINDPNGLVYKNGEYHMFYQLNSFGCRAYDKGWGHVKSKNLFDWENIPPALFADDNGYAISGSALFDRDNKAGFGKDAWILAYSSRFGGASERGQFQNLAYSLDGQKFHKYENNPIIEDNKNLDFRDPKVFWHKPSKNFVMVVACGAKIRFYTSDNLKDWIQASELDDNAFHSEGKIKECPELMEYQIEGEAGKRWILTVSFIDNRRVQHIIGDFDGIKFVMDSTMDLQFADYGKDFYAAVAWNPHDEMAGRKLWIGWMCYWEYALECTNKEGWMGAFTVPRELRLKRHNNGKLYVHQNPAKELSMLTLKGQQLPNMLVIKPKQTYEILFNEACDLSFFIKNEKEKSGKAGFFLCYESGEVVSFTIDFKKRLLTVDRSKCGGEALGEVYKEILTAPVENINCINIRILLDKGCFELFLDDGLICMAALCFPKIHSGTVSYFNQSNADIQIIDPSMKPIRRAEWKY